MRGCVRAASEVLPCPCLEDAAVVFGVFGVCVKGYWLCSVCHFLGLAESSKPV
jgi:hypothetical protein